MSSGVFWAGETEDQYDPEWVEFAVYLQVKDENDSSLSDTPIPIRNKINQLRKE